VTDIPRHHLLAYATALVVIAIVGVHQLRHHGPATAGAAPIHFNAAPDGASGGAPSGPLVVDVSGAVRHPGVYRLRAGARVDDAVRRAGGTSRHADLTGVNLAAKLEDGRQIVVPVRAAAGAAVGGAVASASPAGPINLNTATPEQLDTLDGVGPAMIKKIVDYRTAHGGFSSVDELGQIPGIGERRLAALRPEVTV
jgi:competence protein ComEA